MIDHLAGGIQSEPASEQPSPAAAPPHLAAAAAAAAAEGNGWTGGRHPELRRMSKGSASLLNSGADRDQLPTSTRSEDGERRSAASLSCLSSLVTYTSLSAAENALD